jgi:hypothetical protein
MLKNPISIKRQLVKLRQLTWYRICLMDHSFHFCTEILSPYSHPQSFAARIRSRQCHPRTGLRPSAVYVEQPYLIIARVTCSCSGSDADSGSHVCSFAATEAVVLLKSLQCVRSSVLPTMTSRSPTGCVASHAVCMPGCSAGRLVTRWTGLRSSCSNNNMFCRLPVQS